MSSPVCACGPRCGLVPSRASSYAWGHSPNARKPLHLCACDCGLRVSNRPATYRNGHQPRRDAAEFWARTKSAGDCLEWDGATNSKGYGLVKWEGADWSAHRLAWTLTFGEIPVDVWVLHHCDNPPCVNALGGCLYLGDHDQNVADKVERGRQVDGERHGRAKLSATDVEEIRDRYILPSYEGAHDSNARQLAEEYGVDRTIIQRLMKDQLWRRP